MSGHTCEKNTCCCGVSVKKLQSSSKNCTRSFKNCKHSFSKNCKRSFKKLQAQFSKLHCSFFVSCIAVPVWGAFPALQFLAPCLAETPELPLSSRSFPGRGSKASELAHQLLSKCDSLPISHPGKPCPPPLFENNLPISQPGCKSVSQIILIVRTPI